MNWVMPRTMEDLFTQWRMWRKFVRGKILWKLVLYATVWKLWLERNRRGFNNKSKATEEIVESIDWTLSSWVGKRKEFAGISLEDLNRSWASVLRGLPF